MLLACVRTAIHNRTDLGFERLVTIRALKHTPTTINTFEEQNAILSVRAPIVPKPHTWDVFCASSHDYFRLLLEKYQIDTIIHE